MFAFYKLRFYELDQSLAVGDSDEFAFFLDPHFSHAPDSPVCDGMMLVFANTISKAVPTVSIPCQIHSIFHPQLGAVTSIDTKGLDYRITLRTGEVIEVDAEEHAGTIHAAPFRVVDWAFLVDIHPEELNGHRGDAIRQQSEDIAGS